IADVLVDDGAAILTFAQYEKRGKNRGQDIYDAHEALWEIAIYLDPKYARGDAEGLKRRKVVARLAQKTNITFSHYASELGQRAYLWPDQLAAREALKVARSDPKAPDEQPQLVQDLLSLVRADAVQARRAPFTDESWDSLFG